jgi:hypothetical protein
VSLTDLWPHSKYVELANTEHHTALAGAFCADPIIVKFIAKLKPGDTSCATDTHASSYPAVGRFPLTADDARPAAVDPTGFDHSRKADRRVAAAATGGAITDAVRRIFRQSEQGPGVGLRGGTFTSSFTDSGRSAALSGVRFADDVAVTGSDDYSFDTQAISAHVTVDGPGAEDGDLRVSGVWFGFGVPNTVLESAAASAAATWPCRYRRPSRALRVIGLDRREARGAPGCGDRLRAEEG